MRKLKIIFFYSLKQAFRKKFLAGLLLAGFVVLTLSLALGNLSLDDKGRLTVDFGLASIQLLLMALALFFGSSFISQDLEKKILWMILSKPVRPALFFLARYLALAILLLTATLALSALLITFFWFLNIPIQTILFYSLLGFFMESLFLLACVFFFSAFVSSYLVLFYGLSVFIIGHFLDTILFFVQKEAHPLDSLFLPLIRFLPNLESVNWKSQVVYQSSIELSQFIYSMTYLGVWTAFILTIGLALMEKREF